MSVLKVRRGLARIARAKLPQYGILGALSLFTIAAIDAARGGGPLPAVSWLLLALLAGVLGALYGSAMRAVLWLLGLLPRMAQPVVALCGGFALTGALAESLGAFGRLTGPYRALALRVLGACAGAALGFAVLLLLLAPTPTAPRGRALALRPRARVPLALLLLLAASGCFVADLRYYPAAYPSAHVALRFASLLLSTSALALLTAAWDRRRWLRRAAGVWLAAAIVAPCLGSLWPSSVDELFRGNWPTQLVRVTRDALDFDRDGYAGLLGGGDCDNWNARIHPGVREIPGNGIDDNCLLGDATPAPEKLGLPKRASEPSPYDVILITVDSLRPDHMGFYNPAYGSAGRGTTPNIDAWALKSAVAFNRAYSTGGWTSISVASFMRGLYARRLDWTRYYETLTHRLVREQELKHLPKNEPPLQMFPLAWNDPHPTLAQLFQRRGMQTIAVVHDGFSQMLTKGVGVERNFDYYRQVEVDVPSQQSDAGSVTLVERELARVPKDRRFFLWVHFFGIHSVNEFHPGFRYYGPTQLDGYDHEVLYFDSLWPRLWRAIQRRGGNIVTILTADHGEEFVEPMRMHGFSIKEDDIRVPLFVNVPGVAPKRVSQLASTIDLAPTLLAFTKTPAPANLDGIDLRPWILGDAPSIPRKLLADTWRYTDSGKPIVDYIAALDGHSKLVLNTVDQTYRAFDVRGRQTPLPIYAKGSEALRPFLDRYIESTGGALAPAR